MRAFVTRRLALALPTLILASVVVFALLRVVPGGPVEALLGEEWGDPELAAELRGELGLDLPPWRQYLHWLGGMLHGDLGRSLTLYRGEPVGEIIAQRAGVTFELAFLALIVALALGIPLGTIAAIRRNGLPDHLGRLVALGGISIPHFFLGIGLIFLFGVKLRLPWGAGGFVPLGEDPGANLLHLLLPALVLGAGHAALIMRMLRASMLEVMGRDYIRTAWAKGAGPRAVILKHTLRNALIPVITVIGNSAGALLDGAVITETIFRLPGLGSLMVGSVLGRDLPLVQALVLVVVAIRIGVNLVVDAAYGLLDPRIRYGD